MCFVENNSFLMRYALFPPQKIFFPIFSARWKYFTNFSYFHNCSHINLKAACFIFVIPLMQFYLSNKPHLNHCDPDWVNKSCKRMWKNVVSLYFISDSSLLYETSHSQDFLLPPTWSQSWWTSLVLFFLRHILTLILFSFTQKRQEICILFNPMFTYSHPLDHMF